MFAPRQTSDDVGRPLTTARDHMQAAAPDVVSGGPPPRQRHRPPGWLFAVVALAALLGVARLTTTEPARHSAGPAPPPTAPPASAAAPAPAPLSTRTTPTGALGRAVPGVAGMPVDIALTRLGLYAVQVDPPRLFRIVHGRVVASAPVAAGPSGPAGLAADPAGRLVWVWATRPAGTFAEAYDARSLTPIGTARVPHYTFTAVAAHGRLWLGAELGVFRAAPGQSAATRVGKATAAFGVAVDTRRDRVLATVGNELVAIDAGTGRVEAARRVTLGKPSVAVVGDDVWVGGFASRGQRLLHLHARTLASAGPAGTVAAEVGPGAIVWPGRTVVWVRDGGSEGLSCIDAATGALLEQWPEVQGPVASTSGAAYAVTGAEVVRLQLNRRCTG
jgi:hypothetical protein